MADKNDALAPLLALAEAASKAKEIAAEATAKMNAAKMAQIRANDDLAAAEKMRTEVNALASKLDKRVLEVAAREAAAADVEAAQRQTAAFLAKRTAEVSANEVRAAKALETAQELEAHAKSYEGQAYQKLQAVRAKLGEAEAI